MGTNRSGRKPLPSAVKRARGTYKKDPQRENLLEPKLEPGRPPKPDIVTGDAVASEMWDWLCGMLSEMKVLTLADRLIVQQIAINESVNRKLASKLLHGELTVAESQMYKFTSTTAVRLLGEVGLTPSSRSRLKVVSEEEEENPALSLVARQQVG